MYDNIQFMREEEVIRVFQRDIASINVGYDRLYIRKLLVHSIDFYEEERRLPAGHQGRVWTDAEYQLLINLYKNELDQLQLA